MNLKQIKEPKIYSIATTLRFFFDNTHYDNLSTMSFAISNKMHENIAFHISRFLGNS